MKHQPNFFSVLAISSVLGLGMITTGLANLNPPKQTISEKIEARIEAKEAAKLEKAIAKIEPKKVERPKKEIASEDILVVPEKSPVEAAKQPYILALIERLEREQEEWVIEQAEAKAAEEARIKAEKEAEEERRLALTVPNKDTFIKAERTIHGSLYGTANAAGIPSKITAEIIKALSYDVDFQRDIKRGDKLTVLYEGTANYKGRVVKADKLHYVKIDLGKRDVEIYVTDNGFYYGNGESAKKSLLRTPVDGARITSGFGMRFHPILNYSKMHKGTDFGASTGTPIYAAGDGTIVEAGKKGAYGNYVKIKHNKTYSTAYAHASRFGKGIKPGVKVKQGQVIAYVGTTGRSTGPHLHYELLKNGEQVNPTSATNLNFAGKLGGKELKAFKVKQDQLAAKLKRAPEAGPQLAQYVIKASKEREVASNPVESNTSN